MRLFVAVDLDEGVKRRIGGVVTAWRNVLPSARWVEPRNMHLTLKFLGEVAEERIETLVASIGRSLEGFECFNVRVGGVGVFPSLSRARVLWVGLKEGGSFLLSLFERVEAACVSVGFGAEGRDFHPHVTVARMKRSPSPSLLRQMFAESGDVDAGVQEVGEVVLVRSLLRPSGAVYTPVYRWNLVKRNREASHGQVSGREEAGG